MESVRFEKFTLLIDGIHKSINKIKFDTAPYLGVKSVHVFWIYELALHPEGMTAAEIAAASMVDRSLVSREIAALKKGGYVESDGDGKKRGYNARITLTEKGRELDREHISRIKKLDAIAMEGLNESEKAILMEILPKIRNNLLLEGKSEE